VAAGKDKAKSSGISGRAIGQVLQAAREQMKMSQGGLSEATGMPQAVISRVEGGQREAPRFETVARMAAGLQISLDEVAAACGLGASKPRKVRPKSNMPAVAAEARAIQRELRALQRRVENLIALATSSEPRRKS
jgi:transcriptional regulator with XRE-family HTH domain